jgi:hypothetical protein
LPVNPDELLIFKLRGITSEKKPQAPAPTPAPKPAPVAAIPIPSVKQEITPIPEVKAEKPKQTGWFAQKPKPAPAAPVENAVSMEAKVAAPKPKAAGFFARKPREEKKEERIELPEPLPMEEVKEKEMEALEVPAETYELARRMSPQRPRKEIDVFAVFTGLLFIANALTFGYFIYPQSIFVISYIQKTGLMSFVLSWNYDYDTSVVNLMLMMLMIISGLLTITKSRISEFISGIVCACMVLAVTFEYLNSNATYLLLTSVVSFICIGALAYSRMSAVSMAEKEQAPEDISWPRIETF